MATADRMSKQDVMRLVNQWIGVQGGYLGDFTYRSHREFYPEYCGVDIDPGEIQGTTRERFISVLENADGRAQASIITGTLVRFPVGDGPKTRTPELEDDLRSVARNLEIRSIDGAEWNLTSQVVEAAITDAETLLRTSGPRSAVDRVHTAMHGYLKAACQHYGVDVEDDASTTRLLKVLRREHPTLAIGSAQGSHMSKVLNSTASILDALGPIRNRRSLAHPNDDLLDDEDALLVFNVVRSLLIYLDEKLAELTLATVHRVNQPSIHRERNMYE